MTNLLSICQISELNSQEIGVFRCFCGISVICQTALFYVFIFQFLCVTEIKAYLFHKADVVITHLSHLLQKQNGDSHLSDIKCKKLTYTFAKII